MQSAQESESARIEKLKREIIGVDTATVSPHVSPKSPKGSKKRKNKSPSASLSPHERSLTLSRHEDAVIPADFPQTSALLEQKQQELILNELSSTLDLNPSNKKKRRKPVGEGRTRLLIP